MKTLEERFFSKVNKIENGCWEWTAYIHKSGCGRLKINNTTVDSYRFSYELHFGIIENDLCVCHSCDNRKCVNPEHLFLGTRKENNQDRTYKGRSCKGSKRKNAKLTEENIIEIKDLLSKGFQQKEIAEKYNISKPIISDIKTGKRWKHVVS